MAEPTFNLAWIRAGMAEVPRIEPARLPPWSARMPEAERREAFLRTVLPIILAVDEEIASDRQRLWDLDHRQRTGKTLDADQRLWLMVAAERYRVEIDNMEELKRRMDIIPPSLALAQAAVDSNWGTSDAARNANALFSDGSEARAAPTQRSTGQKAPSRAVRPFANLTEATRAYAHAFNTLPQFRSFRDERDRMRKAGLPLEGTALADRIATSQRDGGYLDQLLSVIRTNDLVAFDRARLEPPR
jgi:Bax protein